MAQKSSQPKIALIGPVLPFRGGIAQYTTQLHRALGKYAEVQTISFKRLYPEWLYPGSGKVNPDPGEPREPGVEYLIDVYNPLTLRRATNKIIHQGCELVIMDWWTLFWWPGLAYMARRLRKKGIKTAFLCHNLFNHKTGGFMGLVDKLMYGASKWMLRQAGAYIVQSSEQRELLHQINPDAELLQRIHPILTIFPAPDKKMAPRGRLELLFFGLIRPYKGLDLLLAAAGQLQDKELYLTIVGEPWDKKVLQAQIAAAKIPNLETRLSYVSDQEAANYVSRADALVLPYRAATGSGVVALAYHYGKPIIATRVGGLQDAVIDGQTGVLVQPNSAEALAAVITKLDRQQLAAMRPNIEAFCQKNSWDAMAEALSKFARQ